MSVSSSVWIVIPTYNRRVDLLECLQSIQALEGGPFPVLVVDNGSTDDTLQRVKKNFPDATIIELNDNKGAATAANIGFSYALTQGADYILRLDSDTVVAPDFLLQLLNEAKRQSQVGIITGKIYYYANPKTIWSLGAFQKKHDLGAIEFARDQEDGPQFKQPQDVDFAWATGMLLTRQVLEATDGFDPAFFLYYEEADLCQRAKQLGYRIRSLPPARMWHKIGQSSRSAWVATNWSRSKMLYFRKHSQGWHTLFLIAYAYLYAIFHALRQTKQGGNRGPFLSAIQGLNQGLIYPLHAKSGK